MQLLDTDAVGVKREKMYRIDQHLACAVAGLTGAPPTNLVPLLTAQLGSRARCSERRTHGGPVQ